MRKIKKTAGIYGDVIGAVGSGALFVPNVIGDIHGFATSDDENDKTLANANRSGAMSILPGVGESRVTRKVLNSAKRGKHPLSNVLGERLGGLSSAAILSLLGAGAGALIANKYGDKITDLTGDANKWHHMATGAGFGAASGAGIALLGELGASALALLKARRSAKEQKEHDMSRNVANWFVPGAGSYNMYKRLGQIHGAELEQDRQDIIKGLV